MLIVLQDHRQIGVSHEFPDSPDMAHGRLKVVAEFEGPACVVISAWRDQKGSKRVARERRQRLRRIRLAFKEGRVITC